MKNKAAQYYALAIAHVIITNTNTHFFDKSIHALANKCFDDDDDDDIDGLFRPISNTLKSDLLFRAGLKALAERKIITEISDEFGPTVFLKSTDADAKYYEWESETNSVANKFKLLDRHAISWLGEALDNINKRVDDSTWAEQTSSEPVEWAPIPITARAPSLMTCSKSFR